MAGHIFLISCLLAICLPIIFVQLPRFATVKELRAETEAETRSAVLRRRPLSPSRTREIIRRITRPWPETNFGLTSAELEQEHSGYTQTARTLGGRRRHMGVPRAIFQGDTCADGGCSSKEEDELKARAGKKPWDPPFRRQLPRAELVGKSPGGRWHVVTDASPPRKTGRDLEARGIAKRLFPSDPVSEMDNGSEYSQRSMTLSGMPQTPQEPLHREPRPKNQPQSHDNKGGLFQEKQVKPPHAPSIPLQRSDADSLPLPLDGSPMPSMYHVPRSALPTKTREHLRCLCRHCRHAHSDSSVPQSPSVASVVPKEPFPLGASPLCHTYPHSCHCHASKSSPSSKGREILMSCKYPDPAHADAQAKRNSERTRQDNIKAASEGSPKETVEAAAKEAIKGTSREAPRAVRKESKAGLPLWQFLLVTMGFIIFVFAFAILVAHCLAWFLVYKTEARLGEVRSGLLRGGEMKLCLCGRG